MTIISEAFCGLGERRLIESRSFQGGGMGLFKGLIRLFKGLRPFKGPIRFLEASGLKSSMRGFIMAS